MRVVQRDNGGGKVLQPPPSPPPPSPPVLQSIDNVTNKMRNNKTSRRVDFFFSHSLLLCHSHFRFSFSRSAVLSSVAALFFALSLLSLTAFGDGQMYNGIYFSSLGVYLRFNTLLKQTSCGFMCAALFILIHTFGSFCLRCLRCPEKKNWKGKTQAKIFNLKTI